MLFKVDYKYENDIELLDAVILLYSETVLKKSISKKRREVLREYMRSGYSPETKRAIRVNLKMTVGNLNTTNHVLQKTGLLLPHPTNQTLKLLNPDLKKLEQAFLESKQKKVFLIHFTDEI